MKLYRGLPAPTRAGDDAEQRARLKAVIEAFDVSVTVFDRSGRAVMSTGGRMGFPGLEDDTRIVGRSFEEMIRAIVATGQVLDAEGREAAWLAERRARHQAPGGEPMRLRLRDGRVLQILDRPTAHGDVVTLREDITREREQQARLEEANRLLAARNADLLATKAELEHASRHDSLTGLANRRYLEEELRRRGAASGRAAAFGVLHVDLDRFKQVNDAFGHAAGDSVLAHAAKVLRAHSGPGDFAARVGGDEFVLLTGGDCEPRALSERAAALETPVRHGGRVFRVGASIGIALAGGPGAPADPGEALIRADMALYRAKGAGRGRFAFFSEALQTELLEERRLQGDLLRAVERGEFSTLFQPQFRAADLRLAGLEALLRWDHPRRGRLLPSEFLHTAGDMDLMRRIDQIVLSRIVEADSAWRAAGLEVPRISLNVSGRRLRDPELVDDIRDCGMAPSRLSLEVLETTFVDAEDEVLSWNLDQLRALGVSIELDDFGTGHSSIVGLIRLRPDRLKIDRGIVGQAAQPTGDALVTGIVGIGRSLGVEVVAEGVETDGQLDRVTRLGCDILQGYALAPPLEPAAVAALLRRTGANQPRTAPPRPGAAGQGAYSAASS